MINTNSFASKRFYYRFKRWFLLKLFGCYIQYCTSCTANFFQEGYALLACILKTSISGNTRFLCILYKLYWKLLVYTHKTCTLLYNLYYGFVPGRACFFLYGSSKLVLLKTSSMKGIYTLKVDGQVLDRCTTTPH